MLPRLSPELVEPMARWHHSRWDLRKPLLKHDLIRHKLRDWYGTGHRPSVPYLYTDTASFPCPLPRSWASVSLGPSQSVGLELSGGHGPTLTPDGVGSEGGPVRTVEVAIRIEDSYGDGDVQSGPR